MMTFSMTMGRFLGSLGARFLRFFLVVFDFTSSGVVSVRLFSWRPGLLLMLVITRKAVL